MNRLPISAIAAACICNSAGCGHNSAGNFVAANQSTAVVSHDDSHAVGPDSALSKLMDGNARFAAGRLEHPNRSEERRELISAGQHPIAVVLSCSDSRVPPEIVFDAGLGELFVVRVAGNTADQAAVGSVEYAVEHLGARLVMVLGHEQCGAVKAAVDSVESASEPAGHLPAVVDPIKPAVEKVLGQGGDVLGRAVHENVKEVVERLRTSEPILAHEVHEAHLKIVGAVYDLKTGKVTVQN